MKKRSIYLVAHYVTRPKDPRKTHIAGYMKDPANMQIDEQVQISTRLRKQDVNAKVIINLSDKVVEQNAFNGKKDFNELFEYFYTGYEKYIDQVMGDLDPTYLAEFKKAHEEIKAE